MNTAARRRRAPLVAFVVLIALLLSSAGVGAQESAPDTGDAGAVDTAVDAGETGDGTTNPQGDAGADETAESDAEDEGARCPIGEVDTRPNADEPRCRPGNRCPDGLVDATPEDSEPTCEEPRCGDLVDLTPDAEEATCMAQAELGSLLAQFEATAAEEVEALAELSEVLGELQGLEGELADLMERLAEVQLRQAGAGAEARFAEMRHEVATEGLQDVTAALEHEEQRLITQAVESYMGGGEIELGVEGALAEFEVGNDLATAREYASVVLGDQLGTVERVDALRTAVGQLEAVVAEVEARAFDDERQVAEIEGQVQDLAERQRRLVDAAEAEAIALADSIAEIQARKQSFAADLQMSGAGGGSIGDLLRTVQTDQAPPEEITGLLAMPLIDTEVASPFGPRIHPIFGGTRMHTGMDLSGGSGEQIFASADGVVVMAGEIGGYGNAVVVDHGNTVSTLYAHMTADAVEVGQEVLQGDLLGFVGSTGYSTGPHLHYEVRLLGQPVDPLSYLDFSAIPG